MPHLVFGLLFLGLAGIWALVVTDVINEDRLPVIAPALLIGAGVIGLAASLASARNRRRTPTPYVEPARGQPTPAPPRRSPSRDRPEPTDRPHHDPARAHEPEDDHTEEIR